MTLYCAFTHLSDDLFKATVIAVSHFSKNPQKYAAHPFVVSGS